MYVGSPTGYDSLPTCMMSYQGNSGGANTSGSLTLTADFNEKTVSGKIYNRTQDNGVKLPDIELRMSAIMRTPTDALAQETDLVKDSKETLQVTDEVADMTVFLWGRMPKKLLENGATILALALQKFLRAKEDNLSYKNGLKIYRSFERYIF